MAPAGAVSPPKEVNPLKKLILGLALGAVLALSGVVVASAWVFNDRPVVVENTCQPNLFTACNGLFSGGIPSGG
jgi:hypothetical protein